MGHIRNIWCLILLFISSFALGQSIDDLTTQYHSLSGRYSLKSVSQLTDSTYLVTGQFIDYRPITNPFTVDSISTGMYMWSNNCEKWLIDSIGTKSGTTIELKIKGSTSNDTPNLNHGAILDYQYGWPPIPVGIAAHLETCIWDDFIYLLNNDIDDITAGVSTIDSTTVSNDSIFIWSKDTPYFTGTASGGSNRYIDVTTLGFANDSTAITNGEVDLLQAQLDLGNKHIYFPPGKYLFNKRNAVTAGIEYVFQVTTSNILIELAEGAELYFNPSTTGTDPTNLFVLNTGSSNFHIRGGELISNTEDYASATSARAGVYIYQAGDYSTFKDIIFRNIQPVTWSSNGGKEHVFENNRIYNPPNALVLGSGSKILNNYFENDSLRNEQSHFVYLFGQNEGCQVIGNTFIKADKFGIKLRADNARDGVKTEYILTNNRFEGGDEAGIDVGTSEDIRTGRFIANNNTFLNQRNGFKLYDGFNGVVANNIFTVDLNADSSTYTFINLGGNESNRKYASALAQHAIISDNIISNEAGGYITQFDASVEPSNGETLVIGSNTYTFVTTVSDTTNQILIAGSASNTLDNAAKLLSSVNDVGGLIGTYIDLPSQIIRDNVTDKVTVILNTDETVTSPASWSKTLDAKDLYPVLKGIVASGAIHEVTYSNNTFKNTNVALNLSNSRYPRVINNTVIGQNGSQSFVLGGNIQSEIRGNKFYDTGASGTLRGDIADFFPVVEDNIGLSDWEFSKEFKPYAFSNVREEVYSNGKAQQIFWYGRDLSAYPFYQNKLYYWSAGDSVVIDSAGTQLGAWVYTFNSNPTSTQFNHKDTLIARINTLANVTASNPKSSYSYGHIFLESVTTLSTNNNISIRVVTGSLLNGNVLNNGTFKYGGQFGERVIWDANTNNYDIEYIAPNKIYEVDSIGQLLNRSFAVGTLIKSKGLDGKGEASYVVESTAPTTSDSVSVIPLSSGYAVYQGDIIVNNFGLVGDNSTDNRNAILKAITYADASGKDYIEIHNTGADTFLVTRAMFLYEDNIHIKGVGNPVIRYRSSHADNYANQGYFPFSSNDLNKHCFFFVENKNVSVKGISFVGDRQSHITGVSGTDTLNVGVAMYMRGVDQFLVEDCNQYNGKSLLQGEGYYDGDTTIVGKILNCRSENFFGAINPPSGTLIQNCDFIQAPSDSTYFDRIGEFGSSSAVYAFAQRRNIQIVNNRFKNVRTVAIKASGSSGELSNIIIEENEFDLCGTALAIGGDSGGDGLHTGIFIRRNMFKNIAGVRAGWTLNETALRIYGSNHVDIIDNSFAYNRDMQSLGRYAIWVQMQSTSAPAITNVRINGNRFYRIDGFDKGTRALQSENILLSNVNEYGLGTFEVKDNYDDGIASNFININRCAHGIITGNVTRAAVFGTVANSTDLIIANNKLLATDEMSNDRAIEYSNVGWSEDFGNEVTLNSDTLSNKSTNWIVQSEGTDRFSPIALERTTGFAFPSEGKPTGMLFYGAGWETGDSLRVGGTWLKYNTEFSSEATLISYVNASVSGIDAYALEDSTGVSDGYIVLRASTTASNGSTYRTQIRSRSNVAGVVAANNGAPISNYGNNEIWAGGGSVNKIVLFSPIATHQINYTLSGYDSASNGFLSFNGQGWIDRSTKQGGVIEINTDVEPSADLKFFFKIH